MTIQPFNSDGGFNTTANVVAGNILVVESIGPAYPSASPAPSLNGFDSVNAINFSASGNVSAHDATFGGNINSAGNFDLDGNASIGGNLFVTGNINFTGNVTQISGNSGVFYGNASTGVGALYAGKTGYTPLPSTIVQITGDDNAYIQTNLQNTNHGNTASMELAITADDGTDVDNYIDMGIASSTWDGTQDNSLGDAVGQRDGYLYVQGGAAGGNLVLGTTTAGYSIKFNAGGPGATNTVGEINSDGISMVGNVAGNYILGNGSQLTGITVSGSNPVSTTGNVSGGNLIATGTVSATGNITANYFFGNGSQLTGLPATYGNSNVATLLSAFGSNTISTTGTITAGNTFTNGNAQIGTALQIIGSTNTLQTTNGSAIQFANRVNFNATGSSIVASGNISGANILGSTLSVSGNVTGANVVTGGIVSATGNVTGNYFIGNGSQLTGIAASYGNSNVTTLLASFGSNTISTSGNVTSGNVLTGGLISATGNVTGGNLRTGGQVSATANIIGGNVTTAGIVSATGNATFNAVSLSGSSGNITGADQVLANAFSASGNVTSGGLTVFGSAIITGNTTVQGTLTYNNLTNITTPNLVFGLANTSTGISANGAGFVVGNTNQASFLYNYGTTAWNSNIAISAVGNLTGGNVLTGGAVSATGNITGAYVIGNGSQLTGLSASYANSNVATFLASFGSNTISTTGTITSGNVTGSNVLTGGQVSAVGNITGAYVIGNGSQLTGLPASYANSNVATFLAAFGSNTISTTGSITSGNVTGSNILTAGLISATGTITGGNLATGGTASATGNITGGNVLTAGLISATGNITGGNISATNHTGTTVSVSGNITGGNIATSGQVSATGNITTANYFVGNIIGTTVSTTGNVSAGNVFINGQSTSYGVVTPAFMVVGLVNTVTGFGVGSTVIFDTVVGNTNSQTSYNASTGVFTLTAGVAYDMSFTPSFISFSNTTGGYVCYEWVDATTNTPLDSTGTGIGTGVPNTETSSQQDNLTARVIYTPVTNQTVKLRVTSGNGTVNLRGSLGTQAIIKPLNPTIAVQATATGTLNTDYIQAGRITSNQTISNAATPQDIIFNTTVATNSGIAYNTSTGVFTLTAGKTYELETQLTYTVMNSTGDYILFNWVDATTNALLDTTGIGTGTIIPTTWASSNASYGTLSKLVYTPSTNQTVKVRITSGFGSGTITAGQGTYAKITQIANQFALNAIDTITTTGNVSVGGNITATGNISAAGSILAVPAWISAGATTITATTTSPTKGVTSQDNISYRRLGAKQWEVVLTYTQTAATGGANGSGDYLFTLPNSLSFDTTLPSQQIYTGSVGANAWALANYIIPSGSGLINNGGLGGQVYPIVYNATKFRILTTTWSNAIQCWGSGYYSMGGDTPRVQLTFRFTST